MLQRRWFVVLTCVALSLPLAVVCPAATPAPKPEGTLTVAVAPPSAISAGYHSSTLGPRTSSSSRCMKTC